MFLQWDGPPTSPFLPDSLMKTLDMWSPASSMLMLMLMLMLMSMLRRMRMLLMLIMMLRRMRMLLIMSLADFCVNF